MVSVILSSSIRGVVSLKVRVERITEPTAPATLGLEKACHAIHRAVNYLVIINNFFLRIDTLSFFR